MDTKEIREGMYSLNPSGLLDAIEELCDEVERLEFTLKSVIWKLEDGKTIEAYLKAKNALEESE